VLYACVYVYTYVCMYDVFMYVCMHGCMYARSYMFIYHNEFFILFAQSHFHQLIGVLINGELDDGKGLARMDMLRHRHEVCASFIISDAIVASLTLQL
jgi:hypothetical protein